MKDPIKKTVAILIALCAVVACFTACGEQAKPPVVKADGMILVWDGTAVTHSYSFVLADYRQGATVEDVLKAARTELALVYEDGDYGMMIHAIGGLVAQSGESGGTYVSVSTNSSFYANEYSTAVSVGHAVYQTASVGVGSIALEKGLVVVFSLGEWSM